MPMERKMKVVLPKNLERIQIVNSKSGGKPVEGSAERQVGGKPYTKVLSKFSHLQSKQSSGGHSVVDGVIYLGNQPATRG